MATAGGIPATRGGARRQYPTHTYQGVPPALFATVCAHSADWPSTVSPLEQPRLSSLVAVGSMRHPINPLTGANLDHAYEPCRW